jgi:N-acetyl sugar amidotransferase
MKYCTKCVMPDTRPKISFDKYGVCGACRASEYKKAIDWTAREKQLKEIFDRYRYTSKWDCIVPVSGGKDSIYQVHVVKKIYNMNPLCVTFRTEARTQLGEQNLQALRDIGVDHLDFSPNAEAFSKLRLKTLREVGDCSLPDHLAIWGLIPNIALKYKIPLIIWGENPDLEYGAPEDQWEVAKFNRAWMATQPILKGKTVQDWADTDILLMDLQSFIYPTEEQLDELGYMPLFLGHYLPWDCDQNYKIAKFYGLAVPPKKHQLGLYEYADIDCMYIVIHHYFKFLKFGVNRFTDHTCNEIRKGRLPRAKAIKMVANNDGMLPPKEYIEHFCKRTKITVKEFWEIAEKWRNQEIWYKDEEGKYQLKDWIGGTKIPDKWRNPLEKGEL